jgi:hypothetical protein
MHQIMMTEVLSQVYPQPETDEREVKAGAIVCIDRAHSAQGSEQVTPGCLISDELNQRIGTVKSQTDADDSYFVVKRA